MKEIYNLIEKYLETEELGAKVRTDQDNEDWQYEMSDAYNRLHDAIDDRKVLEYLPVTVEWLQGDGWQKADGDRMEKYVGNDKLEWVIPTRYLYIFRNARIKHYIGCANVIIDGVSTVAKLQDALELIGIKEQL